MKKLKAKIAHQIWAHWMKYMFTQCKASESGYIIPNHLVNRWERQMNTPFDELPEAEQKSDYEIADKFLGDLTATPSGES